MTERREKMKKKTIISLIAALLLLALALTSCGGSKAVSDKYPTSYSTIAGTDSGVTGSIGHGTTESSSEYKNYNIELIGEFHNGIAPFAVWDYSTSIIENFGTPKYGYMDINGNVIVEPIYDGVTDSKEGAFKVFKWVGVNKKYEILDLKGNVLVSIATENTVDISDVYNGMYYVITKEELVSGNVYTVTYYDMNGDAQFKLENIKKYSNYDFGNVTEQGILLAKIDGVGRIIDKTGKTLNFDYSDFNKTKGYDVSFYSLEEDSNEVGFTLENESGQRVGSYEGYLDMDSMKIVKNRKLEKTAYEKFSEMNIDFGGAIIEKIYVSNDETVATFELRSSSGVTFYAIVDETGNKLMEPNKNFGTVGKFGNGLAAAMDASTGKYGYIDIAGKWAIEPIYTFADDFSEGYATVNNRFDAYVKATDVKVIDTTGKVVLDASWSAE